MATKKRNRAMNERGSWIPRFLEEYRATANQSAACRNTPVDKKTVEKWAKKNPEFGQAYADAKEAVRDAIRGEMFRRGVKGVKRKKFNPKTGESFVEREYSDHILIKLAATNCPEFREKSTVEHTGPDGKPIETKVTHAFDLRNLTNEELDNLERIMLNANRRAGIPDAAELGRN
jgi:hypothetical protein